MIHSWEMAVWLSGFNPGLSCSLSARLGVGGGRGACGVLSEGKWRCETGPCFSSLKQFCVVAKSKGPETGLPGCKFWFCCFLVLSL